jgi:hypothetical protein
VTDRIARGVRALAVSMRDTCVPLTRCALAIGLLSPDGRNNVEPLDGSRSSQ